MSDKRDDKPEFADLQPLEPLPEADLEPIAELEPLEELKPLEEEEPVRPPAAPAKGAKPAGAPRSAAAPKAARGKAEPAPREGILEELSHETEGGLLPDLAGDRPHHPATPSPEASQPAGGEPAAPSAGAADGGGRGSREAMPEGPIKPVLGQKRELEPTPLMLRKAAKILFVGALFPWLVALKPVEGVPVPWGMLYAAKLVTLLGAWFIHQGVIAGYGGETKGFVKTLAGMHKLVPTLLGLVIALGSIALVAGQDGLDLPAAIGEILTLILAAWTFSHIQGYEYGARFNPIFPFMFAGPAVAGALSVFGAAAQFGSNPGLAAVGLLGCVLCGVGGIMAIYSLYLAMKQAKIEGEEKKRLMMEHRKAARAARKSQAGGGKGSPRR